MAENQQINLQAVVTRLGSQVGQAAVDLAAAYEAIDMLQKAVADLTVQLAQAQGAGGEA